MLITPPTDNLYKFLALSGVALVIVSVVGPWQKSQELDHLLIDAETESEILTAEIASVKSDVGIAQTKVEARMKLVSELQAAYDHLETKGGDPSKVKHALETLDGNKDLNTEAARLTEKARDGDVKSARLRGKSRLTRSLLSETFALRSLGWVGAIFGLVLSVLGFGAWYFRVQCYQDALLKSEVTKALATLAAPSEPSTKGSEAPAPENTAPEA